MTIKKYRSFKNGMVYLAILDGGSPIEITDTFLPYYTKDAIGRKQNKLNTSNDVGSRSERWMIGVSTMSGCPCRCKFCATSEIKNWRNLVSKEIVDQVKFIIDKNSEKHLPSKSKEFKINYTRMGEPFLNLSNVREAIREIDKLLPNTNIHHYISTIGIKNSDFSWIKNNITLQLSLHALSEQRRNYLIPYVNKMTIEELGQIRTESNLKTTLNLTLVNKSDFDIHALKKYFDNRCFFIKLSPINPNKTSKKNKLGNGIIESDNLL